MRRNSPERMMMDTQKAYLINTDTVTLNGAGFQQFLGNNPKRVMLAYFSSSTGDLFFKDPNGGVMLWPPSNINGSPLLTYKEHLIYVTFAFGLMNPANVTISFSELVLNLS